MEVLLKFNIYRVMQINLEILELLHAFLAMMLSEYF